MFYIVMIYLYPMFRGVDFKYQLTSVLGASCRKFLGS